MRRPSYPSAVAACCAAISCTVRGSGCGGCGACVRCRVGTHTRFLYGGGCAWCGNKRAASRSSSSSSVRLDVDARSSASGGVTGSGVSDGDPLRDRPSSFGVTAFACLREGDPGDAGCVAVGAIALLFADTGGVDSQEEVAVNLATKVQARRDGRDESGVASGSGGAFRKSDRPRPLSDFRAQTSPKISKDVRPWALGACPLSTLIQAPTQRPTRYSHANHGPERRYNARERRCAVMPSVYNEKRLKVQGMQRMERTWLFTRRHGPRPH